MGGRVQSFDRPSRPGETGACPSRGPVTGRRGGAVQPAVDGQTQLFQRHARPPAPSPDISPALRAGER